MGKGASRAAVLVGADVKRTSGRPAGPGDGIYSCTLQLAGLAFQRWRTVGADCANTNSKSC